MDKKSKEALRRYKKSRQARSSSDSSSSSDSESSSSSSYSSSDSERKAMERHRRKKAKLAAAGALRRSSSSSATERRKREKRDHCQKLLEAKRDHLKRKLKEAKLKKRAAAAAAVLSGHSHRSLSPATQAKLKKLAERKHLRAVSKERREREKEKHRAAARDKEREHHRTSRSPKITKIRIHQDVKRQKSPPRMHHALMTREKIIIQARTRDRTPSAERERRRHEHHKVRHEDELRERDRRDRDRERAEREAARDKERAEALARCQERQRERERIAREKLRREEEEKKYGSSYASERERERMLARGAERDLPMTSRGYSSRERSLEAVERARHASKRDIEYEREREYLEAERRGLLDREELRREREYLAPHRRELSPIDHYNSRLRDHRDLYVEDERERVYGRAYLQDGRHSREPWIDPRELRERELLDIRDPRDIRDIEHDLLMYPEERERLLRERERRGEWKSEWEAGREREWEETVPTSRSGFVGGPKRASLGGSTVAAVKGVSHDTASDPDWDMEEAPESVVTAATSKKADTPNLREATSFATGPRDPWLDKEHHDRRWPTDWRESEEGSPRLTAAGTPTLLHHRSERGRGGYRRTPGERTPTGTNYRSHAPPSLLTLPVQPPGGYHGVTPTRFPSKRSMTYTNPNLIKKQQAALVAAKAAAQASAVAAATTAVAAAKAAAQSAANGSTNPSILGQTATKGDAASGVDKPEAGEIVADNDSNTKVETEDVNVEDKVSGELSEISDSDDDILSKGEKRAKTDTEEAAGEAECKLDSAYGGDQSVATPNKDEPLSVSGEEKPVGCEEDEMLDFEEISDGELEEDARHKAGVGDALGVDWASLIEETKRQVESTTSSSNEHFTTAKQKLQPHRIFLDVGISMQMAGEDYAKKLLIEAQQKLSEELLQLNIKKEVKEETSSQMDEDSRQLMMDTDENTTDVDEKKVECSLIATKPLDELQASTTVNIDQLHPIACMQVAARRQQLREQNLINNACGPNSRALSARQDLKLRRQLCGLPMEDDNFPNPLPPVSSKLKSMAMAAFMRKLEVKTICSGVTRWVN